LSETDRQEGGRSARIIKKSAVPKKRKKADSVVRKRMIPASLFHSGINANAEKRSLKMERRTRARGFYLEG